MLKAARRVSGRKEGGRGGEEQLRQDAETLKVLFYYLESEKKL